MIGSNKNIKRRYRRFASRPDYIEPDRKKFGRIKNRRGLMRIQQVIRKHKNGIAGLPGRELHRLQSRILMGFSCIFLIEAIAYAAHLYMQGEVSERNAERMLAVYDSAVPAQTPETGLRQPADAGAVSGAPGAPTVTYQGYDIIGKLVIHKLGIELPVISYTDDDALKVSVCYFKGALPGEQGNMVITGHNYANGAMFGNLEDLEIGDSVILSTPDGAASEYRVYDAIEIKPDDTAAVDNFQGEYALTLLTCTNHGNRRLLVRCRMV